MRGLFHFSTYPEVTVARLKGLPGRLAVAPGALGYSSGSQGAKPGARKRGNPLRRLYATKRWRDLRLEIALRDGWMCRGCAVPHLLNEVKHHPDSLTVDHIEPHRGNLLLFWDEANLQAVCKRWHDTEKQRQESADHARGKGEGWV
ncbi:HNH endonuclease [Phaeobacter gallaeciensis]|nr:HNH endonuclease [Phaeobacter gallaeciensis]